MVSDFPVVFGVVRVTWGQKHSFPSSLWFFVFILRKKYYKNIRSICFGFMTGSCFISFKNISFDICWNRSDHFTWLNLISVCIFVVVLNEKGILVWMTVLSLAAWLTSKNEPLTHWKNSWWLFKICIWVGLHHKIRWERSCALCVLLSPSVWFLSLQSFCRIHPSVQASAVSHTHRHSKEPSSLPTD